MENQIDFVIPDDVMSDVMTKLNEVSTALLPYLIALSPEERRDLPKMSDKTIPFVEKTLDYTESDPQFAPPYMNKEELANDMKVHGQLTELFRFVQQLDSNLDDTTMEAGAESYVNALSYYNSVKQAAKINVPGAKTIYDDLRKRFQKSSSKAENE